MQNEPDLEGAYAVQSPEDNIRFYRDWADTYDAVFVKRTTYQLPQIAAQTYRDFGGRWPCLDVGCGTGALGEAFPKDAALDGLDISDDMLAVAKAKGLYRNLFRANLKEPLPITDAAYAGLVSSGTFTHGHVGPEALPELARVLCPGGLAVITVKPEIWEDQGFADVFDLLATDGALTRPEIAEVPVYADPEKAPDGHGGDTGFIVTFRKP